MRIGGIYKYNPLVGSFVTGAGFFLSHFNNPLLDRRPGQHGARRAATSSRR